MAWLYAPQYITKRETRLSHLAARIFPVVDSWMMETVSTLVSLMVSSLVEAQRLEMSQLEIFAGFLQSNAEIE